MKMLPLAHLDGVKEEACWIALSDFPAIDAALRGLSLLVRFKLAVVACFRKQNLASI